MSLINVEEIRTYILKYLSESFTAKDLDGVQIDDDFDFLEAGVIDSIGVIEMIAAIEKHFQITVDFEEMDPEEFTILGCFCRYIAESAVANGG